jgi:hypothetical protein
MRRLLASGLIVGTVAGGGYLATHPAPSNRTMPGIAPGALAEPQPTVAQLCTPGYSAIVRPPASYTTALKIRQMKANHLPGSTKDYEEDHQVPLELGGAPRDERNLWPEPWPDAHKKDRAEDAWHAAVCADRAALSEAQTVFLRNQWAAVTAP